MIFIQKMRGSGKFTFWLLLAFFATFWTVPATADIILDNWAPLRSYENHDMQGPHTESWSHTVNAGNNRLLIVVLGSMRWNNYGSIPTSVTFGDQKLTLAIERHDSKYYMPAAQIWYLLNPDVGTNTISVTFRKQGDDGLRQKILQICAQSGSFFNVAQSAPRTLAAGERSADGPAVLNLSPDHAGSLIISSFACCQDNNLSADDERIDVTAQDLTNNQEIYNDYESSEVTDDDETCTKRLRAASLYAIQGASIVAQNLSYDLAKKATWNNVAAVFKPSPLSVTYAADPEAGGSFTGPAQIEPFASITFTATPSAGYVLEDTPEASNGKVSVSGTTYILSDVTTDTIVTAYFEKLGALTVNLTGPDSAQWRINEGVWNNSGDTIDVNPGDQNLNFKDVEGLNTPPDQTVSLALGDCETRIGVYTATATYTAGNNGSISGDATQTVPYNTWTDEVTAVPDAGAVFAGWSDGVTTAGRADILTASISLEANFSNTPPEISIDPETVQVECPDTYTAADALAGVTVADAEEILDPANIMITGVSFPLSDLGSYTLYYDISDSPGLAAATQTRTVIVEDTIPPIFTTFASEGTDMIYQGEVYEYPTVEAWDDCDGPLDVGRDGEVDTDVIGCYILTYTAVDSTGLSVARSILVQVVDEADPSIVKVEVEGPFSVLVTWNNDVAHIDAALVADNYTVSGSGAGSLSPQPASVVLVNSTTVRLLWDDTPGAGEMLNGGDIIIVVPQDFEDNFGNTVGARQGEDSEDAIGIAPVITLIGEVSPLQCNIDVYDEPGATAEDNIDGDVDVDISGTVDTSIPDDYIITYTAADAVGNVSTLTRTVIVEDTTAPDLELAGDAEMDLECGDAFVDPGATAIDACDGDLSADIVVVGGDEVDTGTAGSSFDVTYTSADAAGNESTLTRTVTVVDTTAPVLKLVGDAEMEIECGDLYEEEGATAFDVCDGDLSDDVEIGGDAVDTSVVDASFVITYDVVDSADNAAVQLTRTVTVVDTTAPVLSLFGDNPMILDGVPDYDEPGATAIDACGDTDCSDDILITGEVNPLVEGDYEVSYTVADASGNESSVVRQVIVRRKYCDLLYDLEVNPNPAYPGETVTMRVVKRPASCAVGDLHYEWEKRGAAKGEDFIPITDAGDEPEFLLEEADLQDSGQYRCTISDDMISRHTPVVTLLVTTGIPAAGGLGLALAAVATLVAGAAVLRKKRD